MNSTNSTNPGRGFLRGVGLSHFLDTTAELHALVQGACEVLCPWPPRHRMQPGKLIKEVHDEHHYYMTGRVLGIAGWLSLALSVALTR